MVARKSADTPHRQPTGGQKRDGAGRPVVAPNSEMLDACREIEELQKGMNPKKDRKDYLREAREGAAVFFRSLHAPCWPLTVTADLRVEYLKPIPVNQEIVVEGFVARRDGRQLYHEGEIRNGAGDLLARGQGRFVVIDREKYRRDNSTTKPL